MKLDHFVITTMQRDDGLLIPDRELMAELIKDYGDSDGNLRQIPVSVLSDDPEEVLVASWVWYEGKRLAGRSDGKTLTTFYDLTNKKWRDTPKETPWESRFADMKNSKGGPLFKQHSCLSVVVNSKMARWGGFYKFRSTGAISLSQLYGSLLHIKTLTANKLRGIPMRLVVRPKQVTPDGRATTVYVVHLEIRGSDIQEIQRMALEQARYEQENAKAIAAAQADYRNVLALPGWNEGKDEQAEVAQEFHPEAEPEVLPPAEPDPLMAELTKADQR